MKSALSFCVALLLLVPAARSADDPKPAPGADALKPFARFVGGAWEAEGGGDFKVRVVYEWGLNQKLLKIKSFLKGKDGFKLVYESSVYYHPEKKEVVFQSVSAGGGLFDGTMTVKDQVYTSVFTQFDPEGKPTPFRQTIEFVDDDHVIWTVFGKKGDEWAQLHQVKEKRVKAEPAK